MRYSIYKITNIINNKIYVGVTIKTIQERFQEHCKSPYHLGHSIRKYGQENFKVETLSVHPTEQEMYLGEEKIVNLEFIRRSDTYNSMIGGNGGNTLINYSEDDMIKHGIIKSKAISKMWDNLTPSEKYIRNSKGQKNTNQKIKGDKISKARKDIFLNESDNEKQIRINKAIEGSKKIVKKCCEFCGTKIDPGNFDRHESACYDNPSSHRFGKRPKKIIQKEYKLTSPEAIIHIRKGNIRKICNELNISSYLLLKEEGIIVQKLNKNASKNIISTNTLGWKLNIISS